MIERSDSTGQRDSSTNVTHEIVKLVLASTDPASFSASAIADTFSTTSQGRVGAPESVRTPIQVDGTLSASGLSVATPMGDTSCDPGASAVATDLYNLLPRIPAHMNSGLTWRDSTTVRGCQGGIPTTSQLIRSFAVSGEVVYRGQRAIQIELVDSLTAEGQGMQQQHQITLKTSGAGRATYFIEPTTGRVIHLETTHTLYIRISAGGHESPFLQTVRQEFDIAS